MLIIAWMDDCESPEYPYNVAGGPSRAIYLLLKIGLVWPILTTVWVYLESGNRIPYKDISHPQFHEKKRPLWDFETRMKGFGGHHLRTDYRLALRSLVERGSNPRFEVGSYAEQADDWP